MSSRARTTARRVGSAVMRRTLGRYVNHVASAREEARVAPLERRLRELETEADDLHALPTNFELLKAEVAPSHALNVNMQLLRDEFRALLGRIEELGMAIAPAAGLDAAAIRMGELRDQVNALDRRVRRGVAPAAATSPSAPPAAGSGFDYVGFERRFRGDADSVLAMQRERYEALLADHQPVVDIGCGRGELLSALSERGVTTIGVEPEPGMAAEARERGLDIRQEDAHTFLTSQPDASIGSVITNHVVEHLELDVLIGMLELAARKLKPGGVFIAETPNPASLIVLGNSYILDPTHVRPLHPSLLSFLCERAGFRDVRLEFYSPAEGYHLPLVAAPEAPAWVDDINRAFSQLNQVLFGPQEYAVFARTAG